jgi:hypothetical protein
MFIVGCRSGAGYAYICKIRPTFAHTSPNATL